MITVNDAIIKTFIRLQLASGKKRKETSSYISNICSELYQEIEIEDLVNEIYAEGENRNKEIITKLFSMVDQYVLPEYEDLNIDENGLDEADRLIMEIVESVGEYGFK